MSFWTDTKVGQDLADAFSTGSAKLNGTYLRDNPEARSRERSSNVSRALTSVVGGILAPGLLMANDPTNGTFSLRNVGRKLGFLGNAAKNGVSEVVDGASDILDPSKGASDILDPSKGASYYGSASGSSSPTSHFAYLDAPYAQAYNMSRATAYQEALANSAHQREVADLQAAGLNPVLSANGGSGASVFGGTVYAPGSSGRSVSGFGSGVSGSSVSDVITIVADITGALIGIAGKPGVGNSVSKLGKALGKAFD